MVDLHDLFAERQPYARPGKNMFRVKPCKDVEDLLVILLFESDTIVFQKDRIIHDLRIFSRSDRLLRRDPDCNRRRFLRVPELH